MRSIAFAFLTLTAGTAWAEGQTTEFWQEHIPHGETICARGAPYSFFTSPGTENKIVIDFMGGGSCWNAETCDKDGPFLDNVDILREFERQGLHGIYDRRAEANPLKNWHHIVVSYCTGDIHWGDSSKTYRSSRGDEFVINHKGAVNARAVLEWVKENYPNPERVFVTGCSAGAYGSIYWTPEIARMYPQAKIQQFADSGNGVITDEFFGQAYYNWDITKHGPRHVPDLNPDVHNWRVLGITDMYNRAASFYPQVGFAQHNYADDDVQTFFYELMKGDPTAWTDLLPAAMQQIVDQTPNFRSYIGPGHHHCLIPYDTLYTQEADGVKFIDWFNGLVNGTPVANVGLR